LIQCGRMLQTILPETNLDELDKWEHIYRTFFNHYGKIPNYEDIYEIVHNELANI
jgi:hypothetical protein